MSNEEMKRKWRENISFFRNQRLLSMSKDHWIKVKIPLKMARASHKLIEVVVFRELVEVVVLVPAVGSGLFSV